MATYRLNRPRGRFRHPENSLLFAVTLTVTVTLPMLQCSHCVQHVVPTRGQYGCEQCAQYPVGLQGWHTDMGARLRTAQIAT